MDVLYDVLQITDQLKTLNWPGSKVNDIFRARPLGNFIMWKNRNDEVGGNLPRFAELIDVFWQPNDRGRLVAHLEFGRVAAKELTILA